MTEIHGSSSSGWMRKWGRGLVVLSIGIFAFYGIEHWRGYREWRAFRVEWEAQGETFINRQSSREIPDSDNAAKAPLMVELEDVLRDYPYGFPPDVPQMARGRLVAESVTRPEFKHWTNARGNWRRNQKIKFADARWRDSKLALGPDEVSAARAYLDAFGDDSAIVAEVDAMLERPFLRLPEKTEGKVLSALVAVASTKRYRAIARLRVGDSDGAHADLIRCLRLASLVMSEEPNLSRFTRALSISRGGATILWEGLASEAWNIRQLEEIDRAIRQLNFGRSSLAMFRDLREKDILYATDSALRRKENAQIRAARKRGGTHKGGYPWYDKISPQGWRYLDLRDRLSVYQDVVFSNVDGTTNESTVHGEMLSGLKVFEQPESASDSRLHAWFKDAARWIKGRLRIGKSNGVAMQHVGPNLDNEMYLHIVESAVEHQTLLALAQVAIALERFEQLNKRYPENLEVLVPKFLLEVPPDPWAKEIGDPLHHVVRPGGRPAVWSVGSDRNNDGGWVADDDRDILWQYELAPDDPGPRRYADPNAPNPRRRIPAREIWR